MAPLTPLNEGIQKYLLSHQPHPIVILTSDDRLFTSSEYSDLTITCRGREWRVHKSVVCTQCDPFRKACNGDFVVRVKRG